ncbi:hypothetical protein [Noviherbaspirillum aerium]|nr:hypothetical protein [Noviherbaspirillum aerium]
MDNTPQQTQHTTPEVVYFRSFDDFEAWLANQPQVHKSFPA